MLCNNAKNDTTEVIIQTNSVVKPIDYIIEEINSKIISYVM